MTGFKDEKIIELLGEHSLWAKRACREILSRPRDFAPLLLGVLERTEENAETVTDWEEELHIPSALLLAQMREQAAYPVLVRLIDHEDMDVDILWGDILTEGYSEMLRDTFNGDSSLLPALIESRKAAPFARAMAIRAWGLHYIDSRIDREELVDGLLRLVREVYTGKPDKDDEIVLTYIADCVLEQRLTELLPDIKNLYDKNSVDVHYCGGWDDYMAEFAEPRKSYEDSHIDNAIEILQKWRWFEQNEESDRPDYDDDFYDEKPGRNDPCPCGSGKKYKNCCLGKD